MSLRGLIVINMERRPDRLRCVLLYLTASDIGAVPVYHLAAHDGSKIDYRNGLLTEEATKEMDALRVTRVRNFHAQLSPGAIGCYLSHVDAWRYVSEASGADKEGPYMVLEDDARVPQVIAGPLATAWAICFAEAAGAPFILLAHIICLARCGHRTDGLVIPERFWSTQAYVLNGRTADALLAAGMFPIDVQIDSQLQYYRNSGLLNIYAYDLFENGGTDTDIQVNIRSNAPLDRFKV